MNSTRYTKTLYLWMKEINCPETDSQEESTDEDLPEIPYFTEFLNTTNVGRISPLDISMDDLSPEMRALREDTAEEGSHSSNPMRLGSGDDEELGTQEASGDQDISLQAGRDGYNVIRRRRSRQRRIWDKYAVSDESDPENRSRKNILRKKKPTKSKVVSQGDQKGNNYQNEYIFNPFKNFSNQIPGSNPSNAIDLGSSDEEETGDGNIEFVLVSSDEEYMKSCKDRASDIFK